MLANELINKDDSRPVRFGLEMIPDLLFGAVDTTYQIYVPNQYYIY